LIGIFFWNSPEWPLGTYHAVTHPWEISLCFKSGFWHYGIGWIIFHGDCLWTFFLVLRKALLFLPRVEGWRAFKVLSRPGGIMSSLVVRV
jgi:hypothetical protein